MMTDHDDGRGRGTGDAGGGGLLGGLSKRKNGFVRMGRSLSW